MKKKCDTYLPKITNENGEEVNDPIELEILANENCKEGRCYALFNQQEFLMCGKDENGADLPHPDYIKVGNMPDAE